MIRPDRFLLFVSAMMIPPAAAQDDGLPVLTVGLAAEGEEARIDGRIDEAAWLSIPPFVMRVAMTRPACAALAG